MKDRPLLNKGKKENILQNNNTGLNNKCLSTENIRLVENKSRPRLEYQFYIILMSYFFNFLYCLSNILLLFSRLSDVNRQRVFFLQNGFISVVYESILGHSSAFVFFCEILSRVSIHTFVCLPRLRVPYMWRYNAFTGSLLSSILTI